MRVAVDLDGTGEAHVSTGIGFFDHMLESFARHGGFDLDVETKGDLHIDMHHTVEDTGIVLGQAVAQALAGFAGRAPLRPRLHPDGRDPDALRGRPLQPALPDLAGRASSRPKVGEMDTELFKEFHHAFAMNAGACVHLETLYGENTPPYRRERLQGAGPRAAHGGGARPEDPWTRPLHQGRALGRILHAERRPDRLRVGQPALGRKSACRRPRAGLGGPREVVDHRRSRTAIARADAGRAAGRRRVRRLHGRARGPGRRDRGDDRGGEAAAARRSWASASACSCWPSAGLEFGETPRPRLDRGRRAPHRARRSALQGAAHGLECAGRARCRRAMFARPGRGAAHVLHPLLRHLPEPRRTTSRPRPITAAASRRRWRGATWPACSSTRKSRRPPALRLLANFLEWRP